MCVHVSMCVSFVCVHACVCVCAHARVRRYAVMSRLELVFAAVWALALLPPPLSLFHPFFSLLSVNLFPAHSLSVSQYCSVAVSHFLFLCLSPSCDCVCVCVCVRIKSRVT